ncbi:MAG: Flagellar brake protein YcgR [Lachnoclostridium sp.]|jgi:c-di-GMP-binding flagellar brake protein YcgR
MLSDLISIGDKVDIKPLTNSTKSNKSVNVYKSMVIDFVNEDTINIMMPIKGAKLITLNVGEKYILCFYTKKGLYQCTSVIVDRGRIGKIYALEVQLTSQLEKFQRRQFYRLEYLLEFKYRVLSEAESSDSHKKTSPSDQKMVKLNKIDNKDLTNLLNTLEKEMIGGTIIDLSGGGAKFISGVKHKPDDILLMCMELDGSYKAKTYQIKARVLSSNKMENRKEYYEHRVQFIDIPENDREDIIKFIFEIERRRRNREKQ